MSIERKSPNPYKDLLKGGLGGSGTRKRERFRITEPDEDLLNKYLVRLSSKNLYENRKEFVEKSSEFIKELFGTGNPTVIDFGCGRGEYIIDQAKTFPQRNYLGIDCHLPSLYFGINNSAQENISNVRFIKADLRQIIPAFADNSIEKATILFPPPIINPKHKKRDVLRPDFVSQLHRILKPNGQITFMTDSRHFFTEKVQMILGLELFKKATIEYIYEGMPETRYHQDWIEKKIAIQKGEFYK